MSVVVRLILKKTLFSGQNRFIRMEWRFVYWKVEVTMRVMKRKDGNES